MASFRASVGVCYAPYEYQYIYTHTSIVLTFHGSIELLLISLHVGVIGIRVDTTVSTVVHVLAHLIGAHAAGVGAARL